MTEKLHFFMYIVFLINNFDTFDTFDTLSIFNIIHSHGSYCQLIAKRSLIRWLFPLHLGNHTMRM